MHRRALLGLGLTLLTAATALPAEEPRPILITVDDLPLFPSRMYQRPEVRKAITERMLAALAEHEIRAVGFVTWDRVIHDGDLELLQMWLDAGHELGNHSVHHPDYDKESIPDFICDMEAARARLAAFLEERGGHELRLFRFPMLQEGPTRAKRDAMRSWLAQTGQVNLDVTIWTNDWAFARPFTIWSRREVWPQVELMKDQYQRAIRTAVEVEEALGDELFGRRMPQILLLHASEVGSHEWSDLFAWLVETGHRFATADELLAEAAVVEQHDFAGPYGMGLWRRIEAQQAGEKAANQLTQLFADRTDDWNAGRLEDYCHYYSHDCRLTTPHTTITGYDRVRKRCLAHDPAELGTLSAQLVGIKLLTGAERTDLGNRVPSLPHVATATVNWKLRRPEGPSHGGQSLVVLVRRGGGWRITEETALNGDPRF